MNSSTSDDMSRDIIRLISEMNEAWINGRFEQLPQYFTDDVVMLLPGSNKTIRGVEEMVNSYIDFTQNATVHKFSFVGMEFFEQEGFDIVHAKYNVVYGFQNEQIEGSYLEIYVVAHVQGQLKIAWRTQREI